MGALLQFTAPHHTIVMAASNRFSFYIGKRIMSFLVIHTSSTTFARLNGRGIYDKGEMSGYAINYSDGRGCIQEIFMS